MQNIIPQQKIHALEKEIEVLKSLGKKEVVKKTAKKSSIEGILKGVKFTEKDFKDAKKNWFNESHLLQLKHKK